MTEPPMGYDRVAAEYGQRFVHELDHKPFDRALLDRLVERVRHLGPVGDIGCGPGHVARYLSERGVDAFGLDLSPAMVQVAQHYNPGLRFLPGDMRALPAAAATWGGIVAFYSLIHIPPENLGEVLDEFYRVLIPGGLLLVAFHIGAQVIHLDEWWGKQVCLDFYFFSLTAMADHIRQVGFVVEEALERAPYETVEHPSQRGYILASKPVA